MLSFYLDAIEKGPLSGDLGVNKTHTSTSLSTSNTHNIENASRISTT